MARLNGQWRSGNALEDQRDIVDRVVNALIPPISDIDCASQEARQRREVHREVSRQIGRALWRAERRARQVPTHVRASATYVMRRRRKIAYEVSRAVRSLGAGEELARVIAEKAAMRWPRDGVILPDTTERPDRPPRPRARGESPRQQGKSPRDMGTSLRDRKMNPRAVRKRAAADLSDPVINAAPQLALAPRGFTSAALSAMLPPTEPPAEAAAQSGPPKSIDEIAPEWREAKLKTLEGLDMQTQAKVIRTGREERRRLEELQRAQSLKPRAE